MLKIVMFELSDSEGGSTHRFSVQDTDRQYDNHKTVERMTKEWLKDHEGVTIKSTGISNVSSLLEGWGYAVTVVKDAKTAQKNKEVLDNFFSKVTV